MLFALVTFSLWSYRGDDAVGERLIALRSETSTDTDRNYA